MQNGPKFSLKHHSSMCKNLIFKFLFFLIYYQSWEFASLFASPRHLLSLQWRFVKTVAQGTVARSKMVARSVLSEWGEENKSEPQNYKWQNSKLRCRYRHHLKVALPRWNKECFSRQNCAADGRLCRSRVAAKNFVFLISRNFQEIFNFVFCQILLKFCEILRNSK